MTSVLPRLRSPAAPMFIALSEMLGIGVLACTCDGRISHANPRACDLVGGAPVIDSAPEDWLRSLRPRTPSGIEMHTEDLPPVRALAGETVGSVDVLVSVCGKDRLLETAAVPISNRLGWVRAAVVTLDDVTDRRRQEARLRRVQSTPPPE